MGICHFLFGRLIARYRQWRAESAEMRRIEVECETVHHAFRTR